MAAPDWLDPATEWKECRDTVKRLDSILGDLRKYSFSLVTGIITASSFLGRADASASTAAVPLAIMTMIVALFAVDRYYTCVLSGAVERALDLEGPSIDPDFHDLTLTQTITKYAIHSLAVFVTPVLYLGLLMATRVLASAMAGAGTVNQVQQVFWWCVGLILGYFIYTELRTKTGFFRRKRFTTT